jgi:hypothetical protein
MSRAGLALGCAFAGAALLVSSAAAAPRIASPEACAQVAQFIAQGGFRMPAHVSAQDRAIAEKAKRLADKNGSAAPDAAGQALLKGMNMDPAARAVARTAGKSGATTKDVMAETMKQVGC